MWFFCLKIFSKIISRCRKNRKLEVKFKTINFCGTFLLNSSTPVFEPCRDIFQCWKLFDPNLLLSRFYNFLPWWSAKIYFYYIKLWGYLVLKIRFLVKNLFFENLFEAHNIRMSILDFDLIGSNQTSWIFECVRVNSSSISILIYNFDGFYVIIKINKWFLHTVCNCQMIITVLWTTKVIFIFSITLSKNY